MKNKYEALHKTRCLPLRINLLAHSPDWTTSKWNISILPPTSHNRGIHARNNVRVTRSLDTGARPHVKFENISGGTGPVEP